MQGEPAVPIDALLAQRGWVRALARTLVADPAAADDLEQQAFVEALERPPAAGGSLRAWFATVIRRRARDGWRERDRRGRREAAAARPEGMRSTADVVAEADAHRRVVDAVMALEEPYRETVLLRFFEDLPPRDVAARQGVPVETVRTRTRRALERLRERLDGGSGGDRAAWMAALVPLTGIRWETAAVTGGTIMASKAAVGAVVAAAVIGGVAGGMAVRPAPVDSSTEVATLRARLEQIEARPAPAPASAPGGGDLEGLRARVDRLESAPPPSPPPAVAAPVLAPAAESPAEKVERERRVEGALKDLEAGVKALDAGKKALDELEAKTEDLRRQALDRSLPEEERVLALQKLRFLPGGINQDVVDGMVAFFREATKPATRDGILREVHNRKAPEFKALFLEALRGDADESVRVRAASDIDVYKDDPAVVRALEAARDGDAAEGVRKRAARTLESGGKD